MSSPRRRTVDLGFQLVVREWGEEDARPLVFWPGLTPFVALALNEAGPVWATEYERRVVSISPPGVETDPIPPEQYRLSSLAELVVRLLDKLDLERVAFVGYSWGASLGCHLGARFPDRLSALALLDAGYDDVPDDGVDLQARIEQARAAADERRFTSWDAFLAEAREGRRRWSPALEERLRAGMREIDGRVEVGASAEAAAAAWQGVIVEPPTAQLSAVGESGVPVLLLVSEERGDIPEGRAAVDRFRLSIPRAQVERIAGSGHDLLADQPEITIRTVGEFLRKVD